MASFSADFHYHNYYSGKFIFPIIKKAVILNQFLYNIGISLQVNGLISI